MEKLQKALKKARKTRANAVMAQPRGTEASARSGSAVNSKFPDIWNELRSFSPDPQLLLNNRVFTLEAQRSVNPFDVLRTKLFLLMRENQWSRVAITSPNKNCGKTTTAANLAVGFSRQAEVKSLLLDLDLRRPALASVLGCTPDHDIEALLLGTVRPEEQILRLRDNVAISLSRTPVSDPLQLLLAQRTAEILDSLEQSFAPDVMIFDLPPMLVTDDTRAVLKNVDCALIVARAEHTRLAQLDACEREVSEYTNVLGIVLNNCRLMDKEESYESDYS